MRRRSNKSSVVENKLLSALPADEFDKLRPVLKLVDLELDEVLWEMDERRRHLYFPTSSLICLFYETEDGKSVEVGMTGSQGMVGIVTFVGDARMAKRAVVQQAGQAYCMKASDVETYLEKLPAFKDVCLSYTQALIAQISQNAICNRLHSITEQVCRYLLVTGDNLGSETFKMTQTRIADVLGVRRPSVTKATMELKDRGLIDYTRGNIKILDRKGVLSSTCECYDVVKQQVERIFSKYH